LEEAAHRFEVFPDPIDNWIDWDRDKNKSAGLHEGSCAGLPSSLIMPRHLSGARRFLFVQISFGTNQPFEACATLFLCRI
jgi:hypothetical protein